EAEQKAGSRIREQGLRVSEEELPLVSRAVGIGAVKYADLKHHRLSDYHFDWDKMLSFEGNAGPTIQYGYARVSSIFRKGDVDANQIGPILLEHPAESALGRRLLRFPDTVHQAAGSYEPHRICEHLYLLTRAFSTFYEECPVLRAEGASRASRLALA